MSSSNPGYPAYGFPIDLAAAKAVAAAAEAEAARNGWPVAICILDSTGHTVLFEKLDNTQYGSVEIARAKAETALNFRRPTKAYEDLVAEGGLGLRFLSVRGICALEGGIPLLKDGRIVGAIGVSGVKSTEDAQVAEAGAKALTK